MKKHHAVAFVMLLILIFFAQYAYSDTSKPIPGKHMLIPINNEAIDGYMLYFPEGYNKSKKWPVIMNLHSDAQMGDKVEMVLQHGPAYVVENPKSEAYDLVRKSFIIISPHMTKGEYKERQWYIYNDIINNILKETLKKYEGDEKRVYLTGYSIGATGIWGCISRNPEIYAGVVPVCGYTKSVKRIPPIIKNYKAIKDIPIWVFGNVWDTDTPYRHAADAVWDIEKTGGAKFVKFAHETLEESKGIEGMDLSTTTRIDIAESEEEVLGITHIISRYQIYIHDHGFIFDRPVVYKWLLSHKK